MPRICAVLAVVAFLGGCAGGAVLAPLPPVAERPLTDEFGYPLCARHPSACGVVLGRLEAGRSSVGGGGR